MRRIRIAALLSLLLLFSAAPAHAISLLNLVNGGGTVVSGNGQLTFGGFDANIEASLWGSPSVELSNQWLALAQVFSVDDGFKILGPEIALLGLDLEVSIGYEVSAAPGNQVDAASISFLGFEFGPGAVSGATSSFCDLPGSPDLSNFCAGGSAVDTLEVDGIASLFNWAFDSDALDGPLGLSDFTGLDTIVAESSIISLAKSLKIVHHYSVVPEPNAVPEPALLALLGCTGLALAGMRRQPHAR